jgi:hypothetical protein
MTSAWLSTADLTRLRRATALGRQAYARATERHRRTPKSLESGVTRARATCELLRRRAGGAGCWRGEGCARGSDARFADVIAHARAERRGRRCQRSAVASSACAAQPRLPRGHETQPARDQRSLPGAGAAPGDRFAADLAGANVGRGPGGPLRVDRRKIHRRAPPSPKPWSLISTVARKVRRIKGRSRALPSRARAALCSWAAARCITPFLKLSCL